MRSVTRLSFLDLKIIELIHFQKNLQGGQGRAKGANAPPHPPSERNPDGDRIKQQNKTVL